MSTLVQDLTSTAVLGRSSLIFLAVVPVLYLLFSVFFNLFLHPLRSYPGPLLWRASSLPWKLNLLRGTMHHDLMRFHQMYGDTVRIKPDEISFANAQTWKDIHAQSLGVPSFSRTLSVCPSHPTTTRASWAPTRATTRASAACS